MLAMKIIFEKKEKPVNYTYLSGALQGGMQMIARELVMAGLLQYDDLKKAEEIAAAMITRCEASEREFSKTKN